MPPRRRNPENRGLPARWRFFHGAYYYMVPTGLEDRWDGKRQFRLGRTLAEAHRTWADRVEEPGDLRTIGHLLDRYARQVVPTKAPRTRAGNLEAIKRLRAVFGAMGPRDFKPIHAYTYRDKRGAKAPTAANRELEVLSHVFTKAVEWGVIEHHPMIEGKFRKLHTPPRTRYVEDWEIVEALKLKPYRKRGSVRMIQAYIKIKLLTGRRRSEMLRLRVPDLRNDGMHFILTKTVKHTGQARWIAEWSAELEVAKDEALAARPVDIGPYVFCNARGECYLKEDGSANGWDSIWQRFMDRVLQETDVKERFTEHDLRAKSGSDAESLERARQLLAHASDATTRKVYRRRPERVKPLR